MPPTDVSLEKPQTVARWFVVQTKPRQEQKAQHHLQEQDYRVYLPLIQANKRLRGKWQTVIEALFPGYLFIQVNITEQSLSPVRSTPGVRGVVRFGQEPQPIDDKVIQHLQSQEQHQQAINALQTGDEVEVLSGPLAGLKGIFQNQSSEGRVLILLTLLGAEQSVSLPIDQIGGL